jgi:hypothetical protein
VKPSTAAAHQRRLLRTLTAWLAIRRQATERVTELVAEIRDAEGRQ